MNNLTWINLLRDTYIVKSIAINACAIKMLSSKILLIFQLQISYTHVLNWIVNVEFTCKLDSFVQ